MLQLGCRRLDRPGAEVAGNPLDRVGQPFGSRTVPRRQQGRQPRRGVRLLLDELSQQLQVEPLVAGQPQQAVGRVQPGDHRQAVTRRAGRHRWEQMPRWQRRGTGRRPPWSGRQW